MPRHNPKSRFSKSEYNEDDYENSILVQKFNKVSFREHFLGSRRKILVRDNMVATTAKKNNLKLGKLPKAKFIAFLGRFNKQLYRRFRTIESLYEIDIQFEGITSRGRNDQLWDTMPVGRYFYNVDLKKAYWQIGYKLGYIDHNLFVEYMDNDLFKPALRYCFSFLARKNYMIYNNQNVKTEIKCETDVLNKVYENVRKQLYNEIEIARNGCDSVVEWNIDGVSVLAKDLDIVSKRFSNAGLQYKITECRKIDEYTYSSGTKVKNFKRKI